MKVEMEVKVEMEMEVMIEMEVEIEVEVNNNTSVSDPDRYIFTMSNFLKLKVYYSFIMVVIFAVIMHELYIH